MDKKLTFRGLKQFKILSLTKLYRLRKDKSIDNLSLIYESLLTMFISIYLRKQNKTPSYIPNAKTWEMDLIIKQIVYVGSMPSIAESWNYCWPYPWLVWSCLDQSFFRANPEWCSIFGYIVGYLVICSITFLIDSSFNFW